MRAWDRGPDNRNNPNFNHLRRSGYLLLVFFLSSRVKLSYTEDYSNRPLHYIFENLPWKFAAWICIGYLPSLFAARSCRRILPWESRRRNLPWLFAVRICRKNLPWKFATAICRGFFVFLSKSFFVYVNKSCLYGSKSFLCVSKTFLFVRFFY